MKNKFFVMLAILVAFVLAVIIFDTAKAEANVDWITFGSETDDSYEPTEYLDRIANGEVMLPDLTDDYVDPFTAELYGTNDSYSDNPFAAALSGNVSGTQRYTSNLFPTYFAWDSNEVKLIQEALNNWLKANGYHKSIAVDGVFGPSTSTAVKYYQYKSGLEMDGVLGPKSQKALGLSGLSEKYYFYNVDLASKTSKTGLMIYVSLANRKVIVYQKNWDGWTKIGSTSCTIGKNSTPTPSGSYKVEGKRSSLAKYPEARYCTNFTGGYYFHTTLSKHESTGKAKSHGCIRLPEKYAKWLYDNAPEDTLVIIDDRPSYAE